MRKAISALALAALMATATPVRAQEQPAEEGHYAEDFGVGVGAVFVNLLYMPAKFVYATLGGLTGSFAYLLTGLNYDVADRIWSPSLGGDYVVTTRHLRNQDTLYFSGVLPPDGSSAPAAAPQAQQPDSWGP